MKLKLKLKKHKSLQQTNHQGDNKGTNRRLQMMKRKTLDFGLLNTLSIPLSLVEDVPVQNQEIWLKQEDKISEC